MESKIHSEKQFNIKVQYNEQISKLKRKIEELKKNGITQDAIDKLQPIIALSGTNEEKLNTIEGVLASSEIGMKGVQEVKTIFDYLKSCNLKNRFELDLTLARGLNYYTGAIFEVKALDVQIGSITGGGRYDNLTGIFGLPNLSGVGISFGADRIFDVLNALDLYPQKTTDTTKLLFVNFGDKETAYCMPLASQCRKEGISCEIFPDKAKIKKQMAYANAKRIAFVAMAGENEINENKVTLKNMETGEQMLVDSDKIANVINA